MLNFSLPYILYNAGRLKKVQEILRGDQITKKPHDIRQRINPDKTGFELFSHFNLPLLTFYDKSQRGPHALQRGNEARF